MTERGERHVQRDQHNFTVGPSGLTWENDSLVVNFNEISVPRPPSDWLPKRISGTITFKPSAVTSQVFDIDANGEQRWWPIAPSGKVDVQLDNSSPSWSGHGYLDSNWGTRPLEDAFVMWDWARGSLPDQRSVILYDSIRRDDSSECLALAFALDGTMEHLQAPQVSPLPAGFWGVKRRGHHDLGEQASIVKTLEDGPFYMRSIIRTVLEGQEVDLMHESLSGDRFASPIVKMMLPFRMPRRR